MVITRWAVLATAVALLLAGCSDSNSGSQSARSSRRSTTSTSSTSTPSTTAASGGTQSADCSGTGTPPQHYDHVVVFAFENRSWPQVGGPGFTDMPWMNSQAQHCAWFPDWSEADRTQNSATQYVAQFQGDTQNTVRNDCPRGPQCQSVADNFFRQARVAGKSAVNYVEGATLPCSAEGNAGRHIPAMYFKGADDHKHCAQQVRPYSEFDPANLPDFAFVTPNLCHDGHDCDNTAVDAWAKESIGKVLDSESYRSGKTLVQVWYDEDHPVANMYMAPTAKAGPINTPVDYTSTLKLWQDALGLPCLAGSCTATNLRPLANI